jgi:glycosyltransferase involved in cell wall biosynthesis
MNSPKVSIIIPVYNTEQYLRKCLDSVVNQTMKEIEIIIINDCTPDNSERIILEYQKSDNRIVYIKHEKNLGLGGARNTGINVARGEYQWHIDSDDFIDINACNILYRTAKKYKVEILTFSACNYLLSKGNYFYLDNYFSRDKSICNKVYSGIDFFKESKSRGMFHCAVWLNLFRTSFLKNFSKIFNFRLNAVHQDTDYIPILYTNTKSVFCMHYTPYYRIIRYGSATDSVLTKKKMEDKFSVSLSLINYINKNRINIKHPLTEWMLKDYNNFLNIYNTEYIDRENYFLNIIENINNEISKITGWSHKTNSQKKPSSFKNNLKNMLIHLLNNILKRLK